MLKKTNKKGFTLIELIIVIAIMAVLVALLAPNVLKYLEKSKVNKDINSLDSVLTAISAEITDDVLYKLNTGENGGKVKGMKLTSLKTATDGGLTEKWQTLYFRLAGVSSKTGSTENVDSNAVVLNEDFFESVSTSDATSKIFGSKATNGAWIEFFIDGNGGVAVAAVNGSGIVKYDGSYLAVSKNLTVQGDTIDITPYTA